MKKILLFISLFFLILTFASCDDGECRHENMSQIRLNLPAPSRDTPNTPVIAVIHTFPTTSPQRDIPTRTRSMLPHAQSPDIPSIPARSAPTRSPPSRPRRSDIKYRRSNIPRAALSRAIRNMSAMCVIIPIFRIINNQRDTFSPKIPFCQVVLSRDIPNLHVKTANIHIKRIILLPRDTNMKKRYSQRYPAPNRARKGSPARAEILIR